MAEPLSIIASVTGIATAALQSSKALLELVNDIKGSSEEINAISRDVHAFYAITYTLNTTLKEKVIIDAVGYDEAILEMIKNLSDPLSNCQAVLGELMLKIQRNLKAGSDGKGCRMNLKWGLFTKGEVKPLQSRLEAAKATLNGALDALATYGIVLNFHYVVMLTSPRLCSVRSLALGKLLVTRIPQNRIPDRRFVSESICAGTEAMSGLERRQEIEETLPRPRELPDSISSFVKETQLALRSENHSLHQDFAQIYQELAENRAQIKRLSIAIELREFKAQKSSIALGSDIDARGKMVSSVPGSNTADDQESLADDIFLDSVSRFSSEDSTSSISRLQAMFSGSPDYFFETNPSFYPEQYTTKRLFSDLMPVFAITQSEQDHQIQKYFLTFAETPRRWRRMIMLVAWKSMHDQPDSLRAIAPDNSDVSNSLPAELEKPVRMLLPELELFDSVTRLSLTLGEDDTGQITIHNAETTQDLREVEISDENRILDDIDDLGCLQFLESEIIVKSRVSSTCFLVQVESRTCVERKAAFATAAQTENGFHEFFNDLKLLCSARACTGVTEFIGVVLDDTRMHLKSFIYESPSLGTIHSIMECAKSQSESIPWFIRETWSKQIINAVSDVHSKGLIVGGNFHLIKIGVRADGSAVISEFWTSSRHIQNTRGLMAPELRNKPLGTKLTFRMDIFHLTKLLWRLAEDITHCSSSLFCAKFGCTKYPRYTCTADHRNPVELPVCSPNVPSYFNDIIAKCRSPEPRMRPTARQLTKIISENERLQIDQVDMRDILTKFAATPGPVVICDECGERTTDIRYHCNICDQGDFDLCPACIERGIHCLVPQHRLRKFTWKHCSFVEET